MKHALLVWLLRVLARKEKPFAVLDTHAGLGRYDLESESARRTGEAARGIRRLLEGPPPALADYVSIVQQLGLYPGSSAIARALLRPGDRLICCELHPDDHAILRRHFARDPQVSVHLRDGYEALGALLPPAERRGLVLIDPPYEVADEFDRVVAGLRNAGARFPAGVLAAWYPIKHRAPVRQFHDMICAAGLRDVVAAELCLREPLDATRLNGCGLLVINPPYKFEEEAKPVLQALLARLSGGEPGAGCGIERITDE